MQDVAGADGTPSTQDEVCAFLGDAANHGSAPVRRIDTHAASVFLAGDRALKIKRAVRFPFLDYSTLDRRKAACEAELAVNCAFAPQIYRRVVAITREAGGRLELGGQGAPVEWAVEMTRFDENRTLDRVAREHPLDRALATALAEAIAAGHAAAAPADATGWLDSVPRIIAGNTAALLADGSLPSAAIEALDAASRAAFARHGPLLAARGRAGFVRRCHGDLHLGNIALIDGTPVLFDAIEFDPAIATTDVLYDFAFAAMDLLRYGQAEAANIVLNTYLERGTADDLDGLALLPLFMSMRAAIRAQVLLAKLRRGRGADSAIAQDARAYFDLARRLVAPPSPVLIAVGGLSGTGKSAVARALASHVPPAPGAVVLRSDVVRKALFGIAATAHLPQAAYAPAVTEQVYRELTARARRVLRAGHSAIIDAVCAREHEREAVAAVAKDCGCAFTGLFLQAPLDLRRRRVGARTGDASDATPEVVARQESYDLGMIGWVRIDASGTIADTVAAAAARLPARAGMA